MATTSTNTLLCREASHRKPLPTLSMNDLRDFALAYLKNEYSPNSLDHGPLSTNNTTFKHGIPVSVSSVRSPAEPGGRTMPPNSQRWIAIGIHMRRQTDPPSVEPQTFDDVAALKSLFLDAHTPLGAIHQLSATIRDFSRLKRFSRVRTKLVHAGAWEPLAARLLSDQGMITAFWPPRTRGFVMPDADIEVARRDLQDAGAAVFSSINSAQEYQLRPLARLRQRLPGLNGLTGYQVEGHCMDAYAIARHAGNVSWKHCHREYMAVEDLYDIGPGHRLIKKISFERECTECSAKHHNKVQLIFGPDAEMPKPGELPAYSEMPAERED